MSTIIPVPSLEDMVKFYVEYHPDYNQELNGHKVVDYTVSQDCSGLNDWDESQDLMVKFQLDSRTGCHAVELEYHNVIMFYILNINNLK